MAKPPRRTPIRLSSDVYADSGRIFSLTLCAAHKRTVFRRHSFASTAIAHLDYVCHQFNTDLYAYCLMPDHAHLLAAVGHSRSLIDFVCAWKSLTGREWKRRGGNGTLWQRSFYDHALRSEESVEVVARYILHNPVRAGLVAGWRDYPYSWAMGFE